MLMVLIGEIAEDFLINTKGKRAIILHEKWAFLEGRALEVFPMCAEAGENAVSSRGKAFPPHTDP